MATVTLEMRLTGLCLFVPKYDLADAAHFGSNQMRVLLPDATHHIGMGHEAHLPVLVCRYDDVDRSAGNRTEDDTFAFGGKTWAIFYLTDQDLRIDGASPEKLSIPRYAGAGGVGCSPTPSNYRDFTWVAPMESITPGSGTVDNSCLAATNVPSSVAARAALVSGTIETFKLARDYGEQIALWAFDATQVNQRVLADVVKFSTNIGSGPAKLWTTLFRTTSDLRIAAIFPDGVGSELPIVVLPNLDPTLVFIANMPDADIRKTRIYPKSGFRNPDVHCDHFYNLSTAPGSRNTPFQIAVCKEDVPIGPHQGNPNCPPGRSGSNGLA